MRHVVKVESNLKCGVAATLGPKTLVVGPNGKGKSALINAVEVALSGKASDVAGRQVVASDELLRLLVPPGGVRGKATATLDDGSISEWSIGDGKASRTGVGAAFPLREIYDNLLGTPETAQKWILRQIGQGDLPAKVETLKSEARAAVAKAKALREAATSQAGGLKPEPTDDEIGAMKAHDTADSLRVAEQTLRDAEDAYNVAAERVRKLTTERDALSRGNPELVANGEAIVKIIDAQIAANATSKCGLCAGVTTREALDQRRTAVLSRIATAQAASKAWGEADAAVQTATFDLGVARADAKRALAVVEAMREAKGDDLPAEVIRLRAAWDSVRKLQRDAEAAETSAAQLKARAKTAEDDMARESAKAIQAFESSVNRFLPQGDVFGLSLDPVRFGLKRDDVIHAALSGAEWARVTAALAAAVASVTNFNVVVPEERAFDPVTLAEVLDAFSAVPAQVIVASPIMPTVVPTDWTVVVVGDGASVSATPPSTRLPREEVIQAARSVDASKIADVDRGEPYQISEPTPKPLDPSAFDDDPPPREQAGTKSYDNDEPGPGPTPAVKETETAMQAPAPNEPTGARRPRRKKGESDEAYCARTGQEPPPQRKSSKEPAPPAEPRRSVQPGDSTSVGGAEGPARTQAPQDGRAREPNWCAACEALIYARPCEHGVQPPPSAALSADPSAYD